VTDFSLKTYYERLTTLTSLTGTLRTSVALSQYTSWRVGGMADIVYLPRGVDDLAELLKHTDKHIPVTIIGLGSNVLVREGGIRGVTIILQGSGLNLMNVQAEREIYCEAGVSCGQLARFIARNHLGGGEFLAGIPGTVGGALAMNAGCFDGEIWQRVTQVKSVYRDGRVLWEQPEVYQVAYRTIVPPKHHFLFAAARMRFAAGDKAESLLTIKSLLAKRHATQPTSQPSCGSVFKNPPGQYAAKLIESVGLKGMVHHDAEISAKHANFIVNRGHATAGDILYLVELAKSKVYEKYGIQLETEMRVLGESR